ncbi:MAG: DUF4279 domain-containing protein [Candidatus Thiodiazotropha endolucinida]
MAQVSRSKACLRIIGDSLVPAEITELLQCEPTGAYAKGDIRICKTTGREVSYPRGSWRLKAAEAEPEDLDGQISGIFEKLNPDMSVWKHLSEKYYIDLFVGLFMEESNEGMDISPKSLQLLGERGIVLALEIYDPLK